MYPAPHWDVIPLSDLHHCLSVSLLLCLCVSLPLCLTASLSLCLTISLLLCLIASLSHCITISVPLCLTVSLHHGLNISLPLYLTVSIQGLCLYLCCISNRSDDNGARISIVYPADAAVRGTATLRAQCNVLAMVIGCTDCDTSIYCVVSPMHAVQYVRCRLCPENCQYSRV